MTPSAELTVLRFLAARTRASAAEIGISCRMTAAEVRARLVSLESQRLVAGRPDPDASRGELRRVDVATAEGRRKAGVSDARRQDASPSQPGAMRVIVADWMASQGRS